MKIYITEHLDKAIEHYKIIPILYGKIDTISIPNNSATEVVAIDAIDSIPSNLLVEFVQSIRQKMRVGASLVIGGTELSALARDIINNKISTKDFNELIFNKRGIYRSLDIVDLLKQAELVIDKITIRGYNYEIAASRSNDSNKL